MKIGIKASASPLQHPGKTYQDSTGMHLKVDLSSNGEHGINREISEEFGLHAKAGFNQTVTIVDKDITSSFFAQKVLPESWFRLFANGGSHFIEANKIIYHMDHGKDPEGSMDKPEDSNGPLGLNSGSVKENRSEFIDVKDDFTVVAAINRLNPFAPTAAYANELPSAGNSGNADYSGSPVANFVALAEAGGAASAFLSAVLPAAALYGR